MLRYRRLAGLALVLLLAAPAAASAQRVNVSFDDIDRPTLRILQNFTLRHDDTVRQIVVIGGDARIEGHVSEDVVVVLGKVDLASTAVIDGQLVVVAGTAQIAEGAKVAGDFVVVGGADTPTSFSPGGTQVVVGTAGLGEGLRNLVPWLTKGLLLGRPIVPSLGWVWLVAAVFFFLNLCLSVLFDAPVRTCATTLRSTPFSAFFAGLLVLLLVGPVCVLLAASVIGLVVIPFVLCAVVAAAVLGRIGFARWIGMSAMPQDDPADRGESLRSFVIGSALMTVAYMIPVIGMLTWILAGVFGLGSATLAFYGSYRRENPKPPKPARVVLPPTPAAPAPLDALGGASLHAGDVDAPQPAVPPFASLPPEDASRLTADAGSVPGNGTSVTAFQKAAFGERLAALALDAVAIAVIVQLLSLDRHGDFGDRLMVFFALIYHVGFWTWKGTTPGGMICQLRVVRIDGRPLEFAESLVRGLTGIFSLIVAGLGFLWMLWDPDGQTWHDRVAGTYVVKVPRSVPA
ncbi:MAG TPA: RDD family protein [Vicinamibacterales bacterium]